MLWGTIYFSEQEATTILTDDQITETTTLITTHSTPTTKTYSTAEEELSTTDAQISASTSENAPTDSNVITTVYDLTTTEGVFVSETITPSSQLTEGQVSTTTDGELVTTSDNSGAVSLSQSQISTTNEFENSPYNITCYCSCSSRVTVTSTYANVEELIDEIKINVANVSARRRKHNSAVDARPSAQSIGAVGVVLLAAVGTLIVLPDAIALLVYLKDVLKSLRCVAAIF